MRSQNQRLDFFPTEANDNLDKGDMRNGGKP